jgi:peptidoglycan/LPS O-acetylase OafA/YrhL
MSSISEKVVKEIFQQDKSNFLALDGLRAFAVCAIVFFHCTLFMGFYNRTGTEDNPDAWVMSFSNGFWTGVDIFFVLSGFLIGRTLIQDLHANNKLYYAAFLAKRSFRIFPAYYLVITVSLFIIAPLNVPAFNFLYMTSDWQELLNSSWATYLYLINYVRPGNEPSILSWGWSLSVEEHFYLILPPILWLLFKSKSEKIRVLIIISLVAIPFFGRAVQYILNPDIILLDGFYYYSHNRFDQLFVGVAIAYFYVIYKNGLQRLCEKAGSWLGTVGILGGASVWIFGGLLVDNAFTIVFQFLVMALSTGLILLNVLFIDNTLTRFFSHAFWYPLARISYGTYLLHLFVLFFLMQMYMNYYGDMNFTAATLFVFYFAVMALTSILAGIMFMVLESPMLSIGSKVAKKLKASQQAG